MHFSSFGQSFVPQAPSPNPILSNFTGTFYPCFKFDWGRGRDLEPQTKRGITLWIYRKIYVPLRNLRTGARMDAKI